MIFFLLLFTFITCSENTINTGVDNGDEGKEMVKVPIKLSVEPMKIVGKRNAEPVRKPVTTRSEDFPDPNAVDDTTVEGDAVDENAMIQMHILQYSSEGKLLHKEYFSDMSTDVFSVSFVPGDNCRVYFLANIPQEQYADLQINSSEDDFIKGLDYSTIMGYIKTFKRLPMLGFKVIDIPENFTSDLSVEMKRLVAKLIYTYKVSDEVYGGSNFLFDEMMIRNVPQKVTFDLSGNSPDTTAVPKPDFTVRKLGFPVKTTLPQDIKVYLPHNARGETTATDPKDKSGMKFATCVSIITYTHETPIENAGNTDIEYQTYIGANATNDYNVEANTMYNISMTINGTYPTDKRIKRTNNTSNCYMIPQYIGSSGETKNPNPSVLIPVRRANMSKYLGKQLNDVTTGWTAEVLWRDGISVAINIDQGSPYKEHGYFKVSTGISNPTGNAIIAIRDAGNNILWSWHIWMPRYNDVETDYILHNGHKFMNRVLGSYYINDVVPDDGLQWYYPCYFQWGRKDLFPGCDGTADNKLRKIYSGASGSTTINVTGEIWSTAMLSGGDQTNTMHYATRNPMKLIGYSNSNIYDWFTNYTYFMNPYLWRTENGEKTVNDPCPMGWRVACAKGNTSSKSDWDISQIDTDCKLGGTGTFYYPKSTYINVNHTKPNGIYVYPAVTQQGYFGQSYSASPATKDVFFLEGNLIAYNSFRYKGLAIHCVKIE